ncbi:Cap15 family cyclic dinucleotide receptor domain-containing protein [Labilibaculum euxinus]
MKVISPNLKKITTVSVILVVILYFVGEYFLKIESEKMPLKAGLIMSIVGLYWVFFDKIGWKYDFFRFWGWLTEIPNLNGRFEGFVDRIDENNPHTFVIEIKQTFTSIVVYTYSKNSKGHSITAKFATDELSAKFYFFLNWQCRTKSLKKENEKDDFFGTSIIEVIRDKGIYKLSDEYYTRRNPPTKGVTELEWVGKKLKNEL